MSVYIVRIQLSGASPEDYKKIHEAMFDINFFRYIFGHEKQIYYKLTTAMYHGSASLAAHDLRDYINSLIQKTLGYKLYLMADGSLKHEVLVVVESGTSWILNKAKNDEDDLPPAGRYLVAKI